ncbi:neutrophil cytosol factor 2-like [Salarias fasciatus]|uniref:neutrophil cytosol factor 2-like n=1 Tax=Salarias fasciatus TaxID=181472 RepID=UPI001176BA9B|nr:neutrophil cytosol factor 2-like [Salarias fasciatus]
MRERIKSEVEAFCGIRCESGSAINHLVAAAAMLYTELLKLWDQSVQAVDAKDWQGALAKLDQISEPTSRTLFNAASAHLALDSFMRP